MGSDPSNRMACTMTSLRSVIPECGNTYVEDASRQLNPRPKSNWAGWKPNSQFERSLKESRVAAMYIPSQQAKAVSNSWSSPYDRLVKDLRLLGIATVTAAN